MNEHSQTMTDSQGRLVPIDLVKPLDKLRDQTVQLIVARAHMLRQAVTDFKRDTMSDLTAFLNTSAEEYGKTFGGEKGNVTLMSFDGRHKVLIAIDESIIFDERLQVAKKIIDECIVRWSEGSRSEIRALVTDAFYVDKAGRLNTNRILGLRRLPIEDPEWKRAMQAITDSIQIAESKQYIRIYERDPQGEYKQIALDPAKV
jgi:hypothetical protein